MAVIKSGDSTDQLHIDVVSNAARTTLYNPDGTLATFPAGLTNAELRATAVLTSVTNFPATQDVDIVAADLVVSAVGAISTSVVATLPAVPGAFHYITMIELTKMNGAAVTAAGTIQTVATTNLNGLSWTYGNGEGGVTIGASSSRIFVPAKPIKSATAGVATTITTPLITGVVWRINVVYQATP